MKLDAQFSTLKKTVAAISGHIFRNDALLRQAFTRVSYSNEHPTALHNEVPELIGDAVLSVAVLMAAFNKYATVTEQGLKSDLTESQLSSVKTDLVNKQALAKKMRELDLKDYLRMSRGDVISKQDQEDSVLEDLTEALIGAILLDTNMDVNYTAQCVLRMLNVEKDLPDAKDAIHISDRNDLQEWCQDPRRGFALPVYSERPIESEGFCVTVTVAELSHSESAVGKNVTLACELAAGKMLAYIATLPADIGVRESVNHVGNLQIYLQARGVDIREVVYAAVGEEPLPNKTTRYTMECRYGDHCAVGSALRKKEAKHLAAAAMLALLEQNEKSAAR